MHISKVKLFLMYPEAFLRGDQSVKVVIYVRYSQSGNIKIFIDRMILLSILNEWIKNQNCMHI